MHYVRMLLTNSERRLELEDCSGVGMSTVCIYCRPISDCGNSTSICEFCSTECEQSMPIIPGEFQWQQYAQGSKFPQLELPLLNLQTQMHNVVISTLQ